MPIPSNEVERKLFELIDACQTGAAFTDESNFFYKKVSLRFMTTGNFYHPELDKAKIDLYKNATFVLDQVRTDTISESKYKQKYESIRSKGILSPGYSVIDQDPNSKWSGIVLDGNTRIVLARNCELNGHAPNNATIRVPMVVIEDAALIRFIMLHKMGFQTLLNDHPPADASTANDLKKLIREFIRQESTPSKDHSDEFKANLAKHVHVLAGKNKSYKTIRNYVTEIYNSIAAAGNGIKSFPEPKARAATIRKALEAGKGSVKINPDNWVEDKHEYTHKDWKIYQVSPQRGHLYKEFATEVHRKATGEDKRKSVLVFRTDSKTPEAVRKSQLATFDKLNKMNKWVGKKVFDEEFALGQINGVDEGDLLSEVDIRAGENNLKIVNSK